MSRHRHLSSNERDLATIAFTVSDIVHSLSLRRRRRANVRISEDGGSVLVSMRGNGECFRRALCARLAPHRLWVHPLSGVVLRARAAPPETQAIPILSGLGDVPSLRCMAVVDRGERGVVICCTGRCERHATCEVLRALRKLDVGVWRLDDRSWWVQVYS